MKIEKIVSQSRRDFRAIYVCEHCGDKIEDGGYDDTYFHNVIIPDKKCKKCGKKADEFYRPLAPKYKDYEVV